MGSRGRRSVEITGESVAARIISDICNFSWAGPWGIEKQEFRPAFQKPFAP